MCHNMQSSMCRKCCVTAISLTLLCLRCIFDQFNALTTICKYAIYIQCFVCVYACWMACFGVAWNYSCSTKLGGVFPQRQRNDFPNYKYFKYCKRFCVHNCSLVLISHSVRREPKSNQWGTVVAVNGNLLWFLMRLNWLHFSLKVHWYLYTQVCTYI